MWDRWQKGDAMNEIGRWFLIQGHSSIQRFFPRPQASGRPRDGDRLGTCRCHSEKRSRVVWSPAARPALSRPSWFGPHRRLAERFTVTGADDVTESTRRTRQLGIGRSAGRPVNWQTTRSSPLGIAKLLFSHATQRGWRLPVPYGPQ